MFINEWFFGQLRSSARIVERLPATVWRDDCVPRDTLRSLWWI